VRIRKSLQIMNVFYNMISDIAAVFADMALSPVFQVQAVSKSNIFLAKIKTF